MEKDDKSGVEDTPSKEDDEAVIGSRGSRHVGRKGQLNARDWLEIIGLIKDGVPVGKVAKLFRITPQSIYRGLKKRGIRLEAYTKPTAEVVEDEARKRLIERIKETKEDDFKTTNFLGKLLQNKIAEAQRKAATEGGDGHFARIYDDVRTIRLAIAGMKNVTENKWKILGLDRENEQADVELPELPVREMTDNEIQLIRDKQEIEDIDLDAPEDDIVSDVIEETGEDDEEPEEESIENEDGRVGGDDGSR